MKAILLAAALLAAAISTSVIARGPGGGTSTGTGRVFLPNPVAELGDQTLTDQKDADYAALQPAYHIVTLTNLDGSGYLRGDWANVVSETGDPAFSTINEFIYDRSDDRFEQVMAYYWVTEAQKYIQSLGFGSTRRPINKESQDLRINQWGLDNSFSWDKKDLLRFGKGGVDDAEDTEVILHEYGHAIHDSQVAGFGTSLEAGAIGEGFADYWAVTVTQVLSPTADPGCVADWDSVSYDPTAPHCLRRVDTNLKISDITDPTRIHRNGQIWSRALWDIRNALGNVKADTIILEAQFRWAPDTTFADAARHTVDTANDLYGAGAAGKVLKAFQDREILP